MSLRVLVGPAHWSGQTHKTQLIEVARALLKRGHEVHFVTNPPAPADFPGIVHIVEVEWPAEFDVDVGVRWQSEPAVGLRGELALQAVSTANAWLCAPAGRTLFFKLLALAFDFAVVDAGSLAGIRSM